MNERGPLLKGSQPLLLRRKQLQSGQDPLNVAKIINSTFRQSLPKEDAPSRSSYLDMPTPVPALRRSQTSDVISSHPPPIKGILRESSFSGSMSSSAKASVRFTSAPGATRTPSEGEDDKKRSVRFADFERQALDIRFQLSDSDETYSDVDDDDSTSSPEGVKGMEEMDSKPKPKLLSPLPTPVSPISPSDFPKPRKFTVTPVKESVLGIPVSDLKGLFKAESVEPLESDSEGSFGLKVDDLPLMKVTDEAKLLDGRSFSPPTRDDGAMKESPLRKSESLGLLKRVPAIDNIHALELSGDGPPLKPVPSSGTDISEFVSAQSQFSADSRENLFEIQQGELLSWQKNLDDEFHAKKNELKEQKIKDLAAFKKSFEAEEEAEKLQLRKDLEERIKKTKESLEAEYIEKERELRKLHKAKLDELPSIFQMKLDHEIEKLSAEYDDKLRVWKEEREKSFNKQKNQLDDEIFENIKALKAELKVKIDELKSDNEVNFNEVKASEELKLSELKLLFENEIKELKQKHQHEMKELEDGQKLRMEVMRKDKESELLRCEGEWEDRLTATSLSQKASLESVEKEYEGRLARLKADWEREEAEMRRRRLPLDQQQLPVNYEKLRCEKRLLEDKYRTLKEKYMQLKKDVKIAVEKKLQAKTRRKHADELEKEEHHSAERPKILNKEFQPSSLIAPKITVGEVSPRDVTDPSSDDQYTLSYSHQEKYGSGKKSRSQRQDRTPTSQRDNLRTPIEEISGDIYLRHPLSSQGLSRSAENEFYRQRMSIEEEQPRRDARDPLENNNILGIHQERDLNDLEVSLHRTRALFAEKMIRLRLLGQTLSRLADDTTSPPSSSGGEPMSPSSILQNLDTINAEIRDIWTQLNKNQAGPSCGGGGEGPTKTDEKQVHLPSTRSSGHHHRPSKRSEIEARLQGLRDWLQKPPPVDWAQLTL